MVEEKKEKQKEKKEEKIAVPAKFKKLVDEIENLSALDLAELVKILEDKFGVSATPQVAAPVVAQAPSAPVEEKTSFTVLLRAIGDKKIEVIKAIRDITGRGLKDSKDLVDKAASEPQIVKENVNKEEADELKKKLETAGAQVELK